MEMPAQNGKQPKCTKLINGMVSSGNGNGHFDTSESKTGKALDESQEALIESELLALKKDLIDFLMAMNALANSGISVSIDGLTSVFDGQQNAPLERAQESIANIYGVKQAFVMPNGMLQANIVAMSAVAKPRNTILMQRDSHDSVYAAVIHLGLFPIFIDPEYLPECDVVTCITPTKLEQTLRENPEIKVVFLTSPNHFGIAGDLPRLIRIAHEYGTAVIVDSTQCAYSHFDQQAPTSLAPEGVGADVIIQSTHKMLTTFSQVSLLLINNDKLIEPIREAINTIGIRTSFSYPLLLSVTTALSQMSAQGQSLIAEAMKLSESVRSKINRIPGLYCMGQEILQLNRDVHALDPLRLTVNVSGWHVTGYQVERDLYARGLYPELATLDNIQFMLTPFDDMRQGQRIIDGLYELRREVKASDRSQRIQMLNIDRVQICTPREAFYHPQKRSVFWQAAVGKVSCENVSADSAGSPVLVMGERVTQQVVDYFSAVKIQGGRLKGLTNVDREEIKVIDE
jgi:arginine decarboxylase